MPRFGDPFSGLANGTKLTDEELLRAIRFTVAEEYVATLLHMQLAEPCNKPGRAWLAADKAQAVMRHPLSLLGPRETVSEKS